MIRRFFIHFFNPPTPGNSGDNSNYAHKLRLRFMHYYLLSSFLVIFSCIVLGITLLLLPGVYTIVLTPTLAIAGFGLLIVFGTSLYLLKRGFSEVVAHVILVLAFTFVWIIIFFDTNSLISRIDNIFYVLVLLATTPILTTGNRSTILFYALLNLGVLVVFGTSRVSHDSIPAEFIFDGSIAILLTGIITYNTSRINTSALQKAKEDIQAREEAEKSLAASEKRFRETTEFLPQPIFESDLQGKISYVNRSAYELFGYVPVDLANGFSIFQVIAAEDHARAGENIKRIIENKDSQGNFYHGIHKNGQRFPIQIFTSLIREDDKPAGLRGLILDITERVASEQEIRTSRDQYQSLVDNIPGITYRCLHDKVWTVLFISAGVDRLCGFSSKDFINSSEQSFWSITHPDDRTRITEEVENALRQGNHWELEYRIVHRNGSIRWVFEKGTSVLRQDGSIGFLDGVIIDITDKKETEVSLSSSEARYKSLVDAFPDIIMVSDFNGNIVFGNRRLNEITGITREDYTNRNRTARIHPEDQEKVQAAIMQLIDGLRNTSDIIENRFIDNWGNIHYFSGIMSRIIWQGQPMIQTVSRDVTEKKRIEQELDNYREHLEILVKERTDELAEKNNELLSTNNELKDLNTELIRKSEIINEQNEKLKLTLDTLQKAQLQLVQSEKMASLGILTAGIAHEINNPLNFIMGGYEGLAAYFSETPAKGDERTGYLLDSIKTGVERAASIVGSLNLFNRSRDNFSEECDIQAIMENCLLMLTNSVKNRIDVEKKYETRSFSLRGNVGKLHQAFLNILHNASQAITAEGTISINSKLLDTFLQVDIRDSGEGISKENLGRVLDPFFTTKAPGKGTGLGLSITFNIITEHKGTLQIESEPGKGTLVRVLLPVSA